jgi:sensitive to high expression protein 9
MLAPYMAETKIADLRTSLQTAKQTYLASVSARSTSQREVNDLLQRKPTWRSTDVDRFTLLVREDHDNSRLEEESKAEMDSAEARVESAFTELMNAILKSVPSARPWSLHL